MIECIEFIHSKNVCHFDISLENWLINDVQIIETFQPDGSSKIAFVSDKIQIKLIDFGLAAFFETDNYETSKYCGKSSYKSPEIVSKKDTFNAQSNDIWTLGICLFQMVVGCAPFYKANVSDSLFALVMNGHIVKMLQAWNCMDYVNQLILDLFTSFFQFEPKRITLDRIKAHQWMQ